MSDYDFGISLLSDVDEDDIICLFYDQDKNLFNDGRGFIMLNIFDFVTPNDLYLFRLYKDDLCVKHRSKPGIVCTLYYQ